jgi:RNA-directed DNA polymerase
VGRASTGEVEAKPFQISKQLVLKAYRKVKENGGAAGVDRQDIEDFEKDLRNNLYKIWDRMSSPDLVAATGVGRGNPQRTR